MLGSGPGAPVAATWPRAPFDLVIAINNAWRIRPDWDRLVYPHDFPEDRMPPAPAPGQTLIDETRFVPAMNAQGGFVYGGATMAFTAGYWALHALKPASIAFLGCDMVYPKTGPTHFYGAGRADPLREDISLRSLEAKSARMEIFAARQACALLNLSTGESRLTFPRATQAALKARPRAFNTARVAEAEAQEAALSYRTPTGFFDAAEADLDAIDALDALWLSALD